jgi:hypothetical protein
MNYDGTLGEYCGLITLTAECEHHEHCCIARKKSALTESVVRFYVDIQAYSSWNPKKLVERYLEQDRLCRFYGMYSHYSKV